jgi:hypothetical protein
VAAALLALAGAMALLLVSLFQRDGLTFIWLSLAADAVAITLLVLALRKRFPPAAP